MSAKKVIIIWTIIPIIIAVLYCMLATPIYSSNVVINPPKLSDAGAGLTPAVSGMLALAGVNAQKSDIDITISLLATRALNKIILAQFNAETQKSLKFTMTTTPDPRSGFLQINVKDPNPQLAAAIANYYTIALGRLISDIALHKATSKADFYAQQIPIAKQNLEQTKNDLNKFFTENGIAAGSQSEYSISMTLQLQSQIALLQTELGSMHSYATKDNPDYTYLEAQIKALRQQLEIINMGKGGDITKNDPNLALLAPELTAKYQSLKDNYALKYLVYTILLKQQEANRLDILTEQSPVAIDVIDTAFVPSSPSYPRKGMIILWSGFIPFSSLILFILFRNRKLFLNAN